jgi:serine/threonine protein kinase
MVKPRVDTFLDLVRSSKLVENDQLNRIMSEMKERLGDEAAGEVPKVADYLVSKGLLTQWQCDRLLEGRHKGFFLGKYKLLGHLGSGGMSSVYLAEHVLMQREVAIKVLPKSRVEDSSYLARFHREAQAAAALDHRNIVRAYDVDSEGPIHYLVMEYIDGSDLNVLVKADGPLEYARAADFIRQAAIGLQHAHDAGLIHRDMKPANLILDHHNVVKVLDLGLARFTDEDKASLTMTYDENVLGTADYLAPEQAVDSHAVDSRVDIYGLGCTLYFLLCGEPPFPDGTLPQRIMKHQKAAPPDIRKRRPDAPVDLLRICLRMMAKKPEGRFQTAADVAAILKRWLVAHGHPVEEDSDSGSSSGRLTAAAREAGVLGSGGRAAHPATAKAPARTKPKAPGEAYTDTLSDQDRRTVNGGPARKGEFKEVAPPPEAAALPELRDPMAASMEDEQLPESFAQPNLQPAFRGTASFESYRSRQKGPPIMLWAAIAGVGIFALIALLVLLL